MKLNNYGNLKAISSVTVTTPTTGESVKYEDIYSKCYEDGLALYKGMEDYFNFYNQVRPHQSLHYETPAMRYAPDLFRTNMAA
jgi:transposase InsO family protein